MSELFRFVAVRPFQKRLPRFTIRLAGDTGGLIGDLLTARTGPDARAAMIRVAEEFVGGDEFIGEPEDLELFEALGGFADALEEETHISRSELADRAQDAFGRSAEDLIQESTTAVLRRRLSDSIIVSKILPDQDGDRMNQLSRLMRILDLVERVAREGEDLEIPGAVPSILSQPLIIPSSLFPLPPAPTPPPPDEDDEEERERQREIARLTRREASLRRAIGELMATKPPDFREAEPAAEVEGAATPTPPTSRPSRGFFDSLRLAISRPPARAVGRDVAIRPDTTTARRLLSAEGMTRLASETVELLSELNTAPTETPVPIAVARLETELRNVGVRLVELDDGPQSRRLARVGGSFVTATPFTPATIAEFDVAAPDTRPVPETVGEVRPSGMAALLLVRSHILAYELDELAHIENVLRGEHRERSTRRLRRTEEVLTIETETITEEERDLQSTERFELEQETTKTVQQDEAFNVGVSISASYGPYFQVNSNVGFSSATSTNEMSRKAFSYAKEIIERSASRISDRVRREQTVRTLQEFEENNLHQISNSEGSGNIAGFYQWISKVEHVQILDYGQRLLFDFMVPEPAAFLTKALKASVQVEDDLEEPLPFNKRADEITETNYTIHAQRYHATGIQAPPALYRTVSHTFDDRAEVPGADFTKSAPLDLPAAYKATGGYAVVSFVWWATTEGGEGGDPIDQDVPRVDVIVGRHRWKRKNGDSSTHTFTLDEEMGSIPVAVSTLWIASFTVTIEIECKRDDSLLEQWQIDTHAAITQAYLNLKAAFEEKLAEAAVEAGVDIEGRHPLENRLIERAEIKRLCLSLLTAQHFNKFGSILESPGSIPRIDFDEAASEGRYIRFFEQAFEWKNMTYVFYPYFWGRRSRWVERLLLRDVDPIHAEFLKAGEARVVAPVRPGFEEAVLHFLETGQVWNGGDLPAVGTDLYVNIIDEIKERLDAPGDEIPVFEPWQVRLPTTLVRLGPTDALPRWQQDEDGNWSMITDDEGGGDGEEDDEG